MFAVVCFYDDADLTHIAMFRSEPAERSSLPPAVPVLDAGRRQRRSVGFGGCRQPHQPVRSQSTAHALDDDHAACDARLGRSRSAVGGVAE